MSNYPDFSEHHYCIEQVLGKNSSGGRVTYLAKNLKTRQPVVIKQYQFAQAGNWGAYRAYQSEIRVLRSLDSQDIPHYLDSFETANGFCLVQEYKKAPPLSQGGVFSPQTIKQIALSLLEILVYLQKQTPPVIHGDIKPDNILIDTSNGLQVYLVDFGFARLGSKDMAVSSVIKGTVGFMPPEAMFNRQLTQASDLYSLGATLICLLTQTSSQDINQLIDEKSYQLNFKHLLHQIHPRFVAWLEKMVAPRQGDRFPNALTALQALQPLPIVGGNSWIYQGKNREISPKSLVLGMGIMAAIALVGVSGFMYWQGRTMRELLTTGNCPGCDLPNLQLFKADLMGADLSGANLEAAYLKDSNLENANLRGANLSNAYLKGANLRGANLKGAILTGINLIEANLQGTVLEGANLEGAILNEANLTKANLKFTNLLNAKLKGTRLIQANLEGAKIGGTNLDGAILKGSIMPDGKPYQ